MTLYELMIDESRSIHLDLNDISTVEHIDGKAHLTLKNAKEVVVSIESLMGAFTHSEAKIMSIAKAAE